MLTIRIRSAMSRSSNIQNWVRAFPIKSCFPLFEFGFLPPLLFVFRMCVVIQQRHGHAFVTQVNLYGADMRIYLLLLVMLSGPRACNCSLLWRCIANVSWKRIARIYGLSCSVSIRRLNLNRMSWAGHFCSWSMMMQLETIVCLGSYPSQHPPTLFSSLGRLAAAGSAIRGLQQQVHPFPINLYVTFYMTYLVIATVTRHLNLELW